MVGENVEDCPDAPNVVEVPHVDDLSFFPVDSPFLAGLFELRKPSLDGSEFGFREKRFHEFDNGGKKLVFLIDVLSDRRSTNRAALSSRKKLQKAQRAEGVAATGRFRDHEGLEADRTA